MNFAEDRVMNLKIVERERPAAKVSAMSPTAEEMRNLDIVRSAYEAFQAGNVESLRKILAPNVRYRVAPAGGFTGDYRGVRAVMEFFAQIARETQGSFQVSPAEMAATGNRVFVLYNVSGQRGAKALDTADVGVFTVVAGMVTEAVFYQGDYPAHAAFWS
jgi:uncharacterized protein